MAVELIHTDRRTDMTKFTGTLRAYAKAPKNSRTHATNITLTVEE